MCCYKLCNFFDYSMFDIILLYRLIRNFCFLFELINKWGNKLVSNDLDVGDDIEWIRYFRNLIIVYFVLVEIYNDVFNDFWSDVKCII